MPTPRDRLRAILAQLEQDKLNGRFDEIMSKDATLLVPMFNLQDFSEEAFKANIKAEFNAKIAVRLLTGI